MCVENPNGYALVVVTWGAVHGSSRLGLCNGLATLVVCNDVVVVVDVSGYGVKVVNW